MTDDFIRGRAADVIKRCGTRDPFKICTALHISIMYRDVGALGGMSIVIKRNPFILINENLSLAMRREVCAHELGHLVLHRDLLSGAALLRRCTDMRLDEKPEYEANLFAAALLIDVDELISLMRDGADVDGAARAMRLRPEFAAILLHSAEKKLHRARIEAPRANFLR